MIIFDLSQLLHAAVHSDMKLQHTKSPSERGIRIFCLNKIQYLRLKFREDFGEETIIAVDSGTWRKDFFPQYKYKRNKTRKEDNLDWKEIHGYFDNIKNELKEFFPYKVIEVDKCEGDDVVGILSRYTTEPVIVLSVDKDFAQLHLKHDLAQYCPTRDRFIDFNREDVPYNLFMLIARGDSGDGVPSIISHENCFVTGTRQKPLMEKYIKEAFEYAKKGKLDDFLGPERFARFQQNKTLIDFRCIPIEIKNKIIEKYENYEVKPNNVYKYLVNQNLTSEFIKEIKNF